MVRGRGQEIRLSRSKSPLRVGLGLGTLAAGAIATVTYQARAIALGALILGGTLQSAESPTPTPATAPVGLDLGPDRPADALCRRGLGSMSKWGFRYWGEYTKLP